MSKSITGGCLCGAVRYEVSADPVTTRACHCRDCQHATGSAFSSNVVIREEDFRVTQGETKCFDVESERGFTVSRFFCPECGSPVYGRSAGFPGLFTVRAGGLDDPSGFEPEMMFYMSSAMPWVQVDENIHRFPKMPDA